MEEVWGLRDGFQKREQSGKEADLGGENLLLADVEPEHGRSVVLVLDTLALSGQVALQSRLVVLLPEHFEELQGLLADEHLELHHLGCLQVDKLLVRRKVAAGHQGAQVCHELQWQLVHSELEQFGISHDIIVVRQQVCQNFAWLFFSVQIGTVQPYVKGVEFVFVIEAKAVKQEEIGIAPFAVRVKDLFISSQTLCRMCV